VSGALLRIHFLYRYFYSYFLSRFSFTHGYIIPYSRFDFNSTIVLYVSKSLHCYLVHVCFVVLFHPLVGLPLSQVVILLARNQPTTFTTVSTFLQTPASLHLCFLRPRRIVAYLWRDNSVNLLPHHLIMMRSAVYIPAHIAILSASEESLSALINPAAFQKSIG